MPLLAQAWAPMLAATVLAFVGAVSVLHADEICFSDPAGPQPTKLTFDTGDVVTVLGRDGQTMTYQIPVHGKQMVMTVNQGVFTLQADREGDVSSFAYTAPLPDLGNIAAGDVFDVEAVVSNKARPDSLHRFELQILGVEDYRIGVCLYRVHKIRQRMTTPKGQSIVLRYVHFPSGLTLQTFLPKAGGGWLQFRAIALQ